MQQVQETTTAQKMLTIISNRLHVQRSLLTPETTFTQLNKTPEEVEELLKYICQKFGLPVGVDLNFPDHTNKHVKQPWHLIMPKIKKIWNVLQFIECNDDINGRAAAYNTK